MRCSQPRPSDELIPFYMVMLKNHPELAEKTARKELDARVAEDFKLRQNLRKQALEAENVRREQQLQEELAQNNARREKLENELAIKKIKRKKYLKRLALASPLLIAASVFLGIQIHSDSVKMAQRNKQLALGRSLAKDAKAAADAQAAADAKAAAAQAATASNENRNQNSWIPSKNFGITKNFAWIAVANLPSNYQCTVVGSAGCDAASVVTAKTCSSLTITENMYYDDDSFAGSVSRKFSYIKAGKSFIADFPIDDDTWLNQDNSYGIYVRADCIS